MGSDLKPGQNIVTSHREVPGPTGRRFFLIGITTLLRAGTVLEV